jgi:uncharacterized protein YecT (DUF1311 family)
MRTVLVALGLALMSLPAFAEGMQTTARTEEQQKADKEADAAYKAMTKQLPDKPRNTDPWAAVRTNEAAATTTPPTGAAPSHHQATAKKPKHPAKANSAN